MHHLSVQEECLDDEVLAHLSRLRYGIDYNTDSLEIYACCVPASGKIPGDYVGVVRNGNDARIVTVDGMGKGIKAFAHAHAVTSRFFISAHTNGAEPTLEELSRIFAEKSMTSGVLFSAFMLLDIKEEKDGYGLSIYGMGQPSPLVYRAGSKAVEEVPSLEGVAVGIPIRVNDGKKPYGVFLTRLNIGDGLLAYSDGVTEARNHQGTMFSEANKGLKRSFLRSVKMHRKHPDEIAQDVLYDIMEHCGKNIDEARDVTLQDDITLVVARVKHHDERDVES
ncbi:SpoIIE family protein phosphatase [Candidatus Woesearchaeota archaeon]|nr:SpoIIE family protein phosphatase [Candidatus Woesearchaeota archaeon]